MIFTRAILMIVKQKSGRSADFTSCGWFEDQSNKHLVQFYQSDKNLLPPLYEYISEGLISGERCIVIATPVHREALVTMLETGGIDVEAVVAREDLVLLDAAETLKTLMPGGHFDPAGFLEKISSAMETAKRSGTPIRAFGEMVALLWKSGDKQSTVKLEDMWNGLAKTYDFTLYCAYPALHFLWDETGARNEIKSYHETTLPNLAV
jgi:hypothetical protein